MTSLRHTALAGVVALALAGCAGSEQPTTASMVTQGETETETTPTSAAAAAASADPVEETEENGPDPDDIAAVLEELSMMNQREYRRQFLVPMMDEIGRDEFCMATEGTDATVNPGGEFVTLLMIGAAFSDNTDEDSFDRDELSTLVDWTNEFYEDECNWQMPDYVAGGDADEGGVNPDAIAEAFGEATADPEDLPTEVPSPEALRNEFISDAGVSRDGEFCTDPAQVVDGVGASAECMTDVGVVGFMTSDTMTVEAMAIWLMNASGRMLTTCQGSDFVAYAESMGAADLVFEHVDCQFS